MTIQHTDRTGHVWTFNIDCTTTQGRMFERLLLSVANVGNREKLALSYYENIESNTAFRDGLEHAVLSALKQWAENRPAVSPPSARGTGGEQEDRSPADGGNEREPYYWENF